MVLMITEAMDDVMADHGFTRKKASWVRDSFDLPVVVYHERPKTGGQYCGFGIEFGSPGQRPGESACFQISQGSACGRGHYYDVSSNAGRDLIERDFLAFTAPVAGRFRTGQELASALARSEVPLSAPDRGQVGLVKDLLNIATAHKLIDVEQQAFDLARTLEANSRTREDIRELASFRSELLEAIGWDPVEDPLRPVSRGWWQRWRPRGFQ